MDQHEIRRVAGQRFQSQPHRILPRGAADDGGGSIRAPARRGRVRPVRGRSPPARARPAKASTVRRSIGLAGQGFILFGPARPGAFAFAGGDDQDGNARHRGFLLSVCLTFADPAIAIFVCCCRYLPIYIGMYTVCSNNRHIVASVLPSCVRRSTDRNWPIANALPMPILVIGPRAGDPLCQSGRRAVLRHRRGHSAASRRSPTCCRSTARCSSWSRRRASAMPRRRARCRSFHPAPWRAPRRCHGDAAARTGRRAGDCLRRNAAWRSASTAS